MVSDGRITVTVPVGAVSGAISITTPGGTAGSKGTFTVIYRGVVLRPGRSPSGAAFSSSGSNLAVK